MRRPLFFGDALERGAAEAMDARAIAAAAASERCQSPFVVALLELPDDSLSDRPLLRFD